MSNSELFNKELSYIQSTSLRNFVLMSRAALMIHLGVNG